MWRHRDTIDIAVQISLEPRRGSQGLYCCAPEVVTEARREDEHIGERLNRRDFNALPPFYPTPPSYFLTI